MIRKGIVSGTNGNRATVLFNDLDDGVTEELKIMIGAPLIEVNDVVIVVFFSNSLKDGVIVGKL